MTASEDTGRSRDTARRLAAARQYAQAASVGLAVLGLTVLLGWALGHDGLKTVFVHPPINMKTNTALCFVAAGAALRLLTSPRQDRGRLALARACASFTAAVAALTFSEHIVGWNLGIDELLFRESGAMLATASPNRMGPPANLSFFFYGLSLLLLPSSREWARRWREGMTLVALVISIQAVLGYASGASSLYAVARVTGISFTSALGLFALGTGILAARPEHRVLRLLCRGDEAGTLVRRLTLPALLLPLVAAAVLTRGARTGLFDDAFALAALALILVVCLTAVILRSGGQLARALEQRHAAESERRQREDELREANRRQTEFLAVLSHELRNPLAPMRYALEALPDSGGGPSSSRSVIARQLAHIVRLVDDLLDISRISSGKPQLRKERVLLRRVVDDAVEGQRNEIASAGHTLRVSLPSDPVWLDADPDRLIQVVTNLLANAVRYSPRGGTVSVEAEVRGTEVAIAVRDTGIGLRAEDLERVFEMFTQVAGAGSGGLGIGLALAKGIVEHHGGRIAARSDGLGKGSTIEIVLPTAGPPIVSAPAAVPLSVPSRRRVLLVDDNADSADMLATLLQMHGHDVRVAYDGESALRAFAEVPPDVAVFDIGLPDVDGCELARRVRADGHAAYLIAVTGWGQGSDRARTRAAGFDAHLTKPADPQEVRRRVEEAPVVAELVPRGRLVP